MVVENEVEYQKKQIEMLECDNKALRAELNEMRKALKNTEERAQLAESLLNDISPKVKYLEGQIEAFKYCISKFS